MSTPIVDERRARRWLSWAGVRLREAGVEGPELEAELLAAFVLGCERVALITGDLVITPEALTKLNAILEQRTRRVPLAYLVGKREFYSLEFKVTSEVLIPRPETELLVEVALEAVDRRARGVRIADLGTGCGTIALTLAHERPQLELVATDISPSALALAAINAKRLGSRGVEFRLGDWWQALGDERFDLILSNPPYIPLAALDELAPEVACFEPRLALVGGNDGLACYRLLAEGAKAHLVAGGEMMVEVGEGQADAVAALFQAGGARTITCWQDLAGQQRVVTGRWD